MSGETVLIIEDRREHIVFLANQVLKPNGYQVITAMDGQRGLKRILTEKPDLVILDLNMPKMDGLEILKALREHQAEVPVILITFYGSEHVAQQALQLGAAAYVVKPFTAAEMLKAIQKALSSRRSATPPAPEPEVTMPLTRQVERWMRDMNILHRVGKALVGHLNMERVCSRAVEAAIYLTRADNAFLFLTDESGASLRLYATRGPEDRQVRILDRAVDGGLAAQVARSGQAVILPRGQSDPVLVDIAGELLGAPIAVPLRWQQRTWGVLIAARHAGEQPFTEADLEWLNGLAEYVAIALRNAQVCQQRTQPPPAPRLNEEMVNTWQQELEQVATQVQAVAATIQQLAADVETMLCSTTNQAQAVVATIRQLTEQMANREKWSNPSTRGQA